MALDAFIKLDGIEGECADSKHFGWIELLEFEMHIGQSVYRTASSVGGASTGRADFSEFCFTKLLDKASPKLALACAAGTHIDHIVVELCRAGGEKLRYMQYRFKNCMINSFITLAEDDFPEDEVAFVYGKVEWTYSQQNRTGGFGVGNMAAGWNLERNCKS